MKMSKYTGKKNFVKSKSRHTQKERDECKFLCMRILCLVYFEIIYNFERKIGRGRSCE